MISVLSLLITLPLTTFLCYNCVILQVKDSKNTTVPCQINPVLEKEQIMPSTFEVLFISNVPALGVSHYTLMYGTEGSVLATVQYINHQLSRYS